MKMRSGPPFSFFLMQSELPYWGNISIFAQNKKCDSYRYLTHLKILEDGLGCLTELWKYRYF
jgi:hypothetical protein